MSDHPVNPERARGTVLVVDDEPQVLRTACMALEMVGYRTFSASSSAEAAIICHQAGPIDVVVMDVVLKDEHGYDVVPCLQAIQPGLRALYISGYPGQLLFESRGIEDPFLFKPFTPQELIDAVDSLCRARHARAA